MYMCSYVRVQILNIWVFIVSWWIFVCSDSSVPALPFAFKWPITGEITLNVGKYLKAVKYLTTSWPVPSV